MSPTLLMLLTFLAVALTVFGIYSVFADLFVRDRSRMQQRLDEEFRLQQRDQIRRSALFTNLGQIAGAADAELRETLPQRFAHVVEQSALNITPKQLACTMAGLGLGMSMLMIVVGQSVLHVAAAATLGFVPFVYVLMKRNKRISRMTNQLPHAFDLMARVIRAGQTMPQAIQAVGDGFDEPLASEFTYCFEQQNLGLSPELSLRDLARRTGLLEVKIFVLALVVQQESGGNLAELLEKLATIMRERCKIKGKISALTAEGRLQALVLLLLPPLVLGVILMVNRGYAQLLLDNPGLLVGMFVAEAIGAFWVRRIVNFDF